jgi:hypothetical protein
MFDYFAQRRMVSSAGAMPHLLPAGPFLGSEPTAIEVSHGSGIADYPPPSPESVTLAVEDL